MFILKEMARFCVLALTYLVVASAMDGALQASGLESSSFAGAVTRGGAMFLVIMGCLLIYYRLLNPNLPTKT